MGFDGSEIKKRKIEIKKPCAPETARLPGRSEEGEQTIIINKNNKKGIGDFLLSKLTGEYICIQCGYQGHRKTLVKGNLFIEIILWLFFIIPGIIYSLLRVFSKKKGCPKCYGPMIHIKSPRGTILIESLKINERPRAS